MPVLVVHGLELSSERIPANCRGELLSRGMGGRPEA